MTVGGIRRGRGRVVVRLRQVDVRTGHRHLHRGHIRQAVRVIPHRVAELRAADEVHGGREPDLAAGRDRDGPRAAGGGDTIVSVAGLSASPGSGSTSLSSTGKFAGVFANVENESLLAIGGSGVSGGSGLTVTDTVIAADGRPNSLRMRYVNVSAGASDRPAPSHSRAAIDSECDRRSAA